MSKLTDYVPALQEDDEKGYIKINGGKVPIKFTMQTMHYVSKVYGAPFQKMSSDMNKLTGAEATPLNPKFMRIMRALLYGMVHSAGVETTPDELINAIPVREMESVLTDVLEFFQANYFQAEDANKIKEDNNTKK